MLSRIQHALVLDLTQNFLMEIDADNFGEIPDDTLGAAIRMHWHAEPLMNKQYLHINQKVITA